MADSRYSDTQDSHGFFKFIIRFLLKIMWSVGGKLDGVDGLPRVRGDDIRPALAKFEPGDILFVGNSGGLSHVMMYVGPDTVIHSMATEKTMRGQMGSLWDALRRPIWWTFGFRDKTGVIKESLTAFLDRYERDTWALARRVDLSAEQIDTGLAHIETLIGAKYDYDFNAGDDEYYCTEIVTEYLEAAGVPESFPTRHVKLPLLLDTHIIEPISLLSSVEIRPVLASESSQVKFAEELTGAEVV